MVQSKDLQGESGSPDLQSMNQIVRWINTKEDHCKKIITTVGEYCLCQRLKPDALSPEEYTEALKAHHAVMQKAMKAKQTMDTAACDALDAAIELFGKMYTK